MILGMSTETYTLTHVVISLLGIASGFIVLFGFLTGRRLDGWNASFLVTNVLTSAGGFAFPIKELGPPHFVGIIALVVLALAIAARYAFSWPRTYIVCAVIALYLNVFVGVVQAFQKIPALHALAPKQNEPPFAIAQTIVLVLFVLLGVKSARRRALAR